MPPIPVTAPSISNREEDLMNNEPTLSGKTIVGVINPPPDIRTIVDKTAAFVARNGADFENKIRERETNNPRFNFLIPTDPYHAYYKQKVRDSQDGRPEARAMVPEAVKEAVKKAEFIPQKPPPPFEFCSDPATINAYDLDLIRMTAIFVARNGRQFLTQLMTREARNYQFDFLKPAHSNFQYFTKLVEQYNKVIIPATDILDQLKEEKGNNKKLLEDVKYRVAWEKHQKGLKDKEEKAAEKERLAYASIDWHDFVVVQTVDFQPTDNSNLPALCTPQDVGARILLEQRAEQQKQTAEAVEMDMEDSESEDEEQEPEPIRNEVADMEVEADEPEPRFTAMPPSKQKDIVVKDYDPKRAQAARPIRQSDGWYISPLTGERIPADKIDKHVRYNTLDSQYLEDRDRQVGEKGSDEPVLAHGSEISKNLGRFAERRTDIFGVGAAGAEQTIIGRKMGEEEQPMQPSKPIWDGSEETREAHTKALQSNVTIDQQIHEIHRQHGFLSDPAKERIGAQHGSGALPPRVASGANSVPVNARRPFPPATPPMPGSSQTSDGPAHKRQRMEEDLEPESLWLQKVSGEIDLRLQLPVSEEFNMDGKIVALKCNVSSSVQDLKQLIQDRYEMPSNKQKLLFDAMFLKDQHSLAFYNLNNHSFILVQVKERGGKK